MLESKTEAVIALADEKNFTRAAQVLSLTQPAVSHLIRQYEQELNTTLFIRKKGEVVPTAQGETVIAYARRFKSLHEKMLRELNDAENNVTRLRIGLTHTSESNAITEIIGKFSAQSVGLKITVITDTIKNLYTMLENYALDLAIVEGKPAPGDLNSLMLDTDYLVCVVSPSHPLAKHSIVTLGELKKEQMILRLPTSATRMLFESTLESLNETIDNFNIILEVDNIQTIKDLVRKELGISILARSTCLDELRKGKLIAMPIENLSMVRQTNIIYNKYFQHHTILKDIVKIYRKEMENMENR